MKLFYALCFCLAACDQHEIVRHNTGQVEHSPNKVSYQQSIAQRDRIKQHCKGDLIKSSGVRFTEFVINQIFPYWYGTD